MKPDEKRKLYKLYQALVLEALVEEMLIEEVIRTFYPMQNLTEYMFHRHFKEVKELQVWPQAGRCTCPA